VRSPDDASSATGILREVVGPAGLEPATERL
jgi:hypothetical protein